MARPSNGPKGPTPEEIDEFVDLINADIDLAMQQPNPDARVNALQRLIEVLDWAGEQINKRRAYSKKFQLKDKERTRLLKERLGEGYEDVLKEASKRAENRLFEEVANEPASKRELAELNSEKE